MLVGSELALRSPRGLKPHENEKNDYVGLLDC